MNIVPEQLKAVLVDLDGTLVDSMPILYKVYYEFLRGFGFSGSDADFKKLIGPSIREVVVLLKRRYQLSEDEDELFKRYCHLLDDKYKNEVQLFNGVKEFLEFLARMPLQLILVTSAVSSTAEEVVSRLGINKFFSKIVAADAVRKSKPDPEIYKKALEVSEVSANQAVAIEDSSAGIRAALGAGIMPIWIRHKKRASLKHHRDPLLIEASDWREIYRLFACWMKHGSI